MVVGFAEIGKDDVSKAGGKGANLGEMTQAGIAVPPGFVLTSDAYRLFLKENALDTFICERIQDTNGEKELILAAEQIRERIRKGVFPETILTDVKKNYESLRDSEGKVARVAVRSSATAEDLEDASFAGQQETYLNVTSYEVLVDKIRECYVSLWGNRAVLYREKQGYNDENVALAVVVQQMVQSKKAGVIFTSNIINGCKEEILINASYGLGESVVSGRVTPDEYLCDKTGVVKKVTIGSKQIEILYDVAGTKEIEVSKERREQAALSKAEINELIKAAVLIENHYGKPMDIEWGIDKDRVYILQARAITTVGNDNEKVEDMDLPKITLSESGRKMMLFMLEKMPFAYYPLDYGISTITGLEKEKLFRDAGIDKQTLMRMDDRGIMSLPSSKVHINKNIWHIGKTISDYKNTEVNERIGREKLKKAREKMHEFEGICYNTCSLQECGRLLISLHDYLEELTYGRFRYAVFPSFILGKGLEKKLKKINSNWSEYHLLGNLEYKTAVINREMKQMVEYLSKVQGLSEEVLKEESMDKLCEKYPVMKEKVDAFLVHNGYKSDFNCYCLIAKSWNEDKQRLLNVMRPMFIAEREKKKDEMENAPLYEDILKGLRETLGDKKYKKIEKKIEFYRFSHVYREESQYLWEGAFEKERRLYDRLCNLLAKNLKEKDDLKYLFYDELLVVCKKGKIEESMIAKINMRKANRSLAQQIWEHYKAAILNNKEEKTLSGIIGSSGSSTGKACIVKEPNEFYKLKKGDVLVCPYTDPEWTSLFTLATAVVSDIGGALSHAAIVAREYGIPAVLGTGNATTVLKDGDMVFVDGSTGEVKRIES
jgi:rifampicin phosphotransferase